MDSPNPLASDGLPFEFTAFHLVGQAASGAVDTLIGGDPLPMSTPGVTGARTQELPMYLDLVDLPASG